MCHANFEPFAKYIFIIFTTKSSHKVPAKIRNNEGRPKTSVPPPKRSVRPPKDSVRPPKTLNSRLEFRCCHPGPWSRCWRPGPWFPPGTPPDDG